MAPRVRPLRLAAALGGVVLVIALLGVDPVQDGMWAVLDLSTDVILEHPVLGLLLFVTLSAVSAVAFFFSTALIVPVAIHAWGRPATLLLLWSSWMLGATVSYWLGRHPGRRLARWLVPDPRVATYAQQLSARASAPLVLLFQLAVPSEIPGLVLGAVHYDFVKYLGTRAVAEVPFALGTVYLGDSLMQGEAARLLAVGLAGVTLTGAALYLLRRRLQGP